MYLPFVIFVAFLPIAFFLAFISLLYSHIPGVSLIEEVKKKPFLLKFFDVVREFLNYKKYDNGL